MSKVVQSMMGGSKGFAKAVGDTIKQTFEETSEKVNTATREFREDLTPQELLEVSFADKNQVVVKQKFEVAEAITNAAANLLGVACCVCGLGEMPNRYDVSLSSSNNNNNNETKFTSHEQSDLHGWTGRCLCRPHHKLQMFVQNERGQDMLWLDRGCKLGCCFSCFECCRQEMDVYVAGKQHRQNNDPLYGYAIHMQSSDAKILASIQEPILGCTATSNAGLSPVLEIMDREGTSNLTDNHNAERLLLLQAEAICCIGGICCDHKFHILDGKDPNKVLGVIVKRRPGNQKQTVVELVADSMDRYTIVMPQELPVKTKAALLAAVHLIDYWMFEGEGECCSPMNLIKGQVAVKLCNFYCCGCVCPIGLRRYNAWCWCPMIT